MIKKKHATYRSIKSPYGGIYAICPFYTKPARREAISCIVDNLNGKYTWRQLKSDGWKAVKVNIVEEK